MKTKPVLIWIIGLALGFAGGWLVRSQLGNLSPTVLASAESPRASPKSDSPNPVARIEPSKELREPLDPAKTQRMQTVSRLSTLAGEKKHGLAISVPVFVYGNEGIDPTFARVYDLSPGEVAVLNDAIKAAKEKFNAIAIQTAKTQLSDDGSRLVVDVPTVVDQGGVIYEQLLQTFEGVLGPDRFQSFNALSGETFDNGFGSFGLWSSRYEVSVSAPATVNRAAVYRINMTSTGPNGSSNGNLTMNLKGLSSQFPVLGHFIPAGFESRPGGK